MYFMSNAKVPYDLMIRFFSGLATTNEQQSLEVWRKASDENERVFIEMKTIWSVSDSKNSFFESSTEAALAKVSKQLNEQKPKHVIGLRERFTPIIRIAAIILVIVGISSFYFLFMRHGNMIIETQSAGQYVALSDGTKVWLNKNSSISFLESFDAKQRKITLKGEAYFDVNRDTLRPFIIETIESEVTVLGTEFNIRAYDNEEDVQVSVTEGKVAFSNDRDRVTLVVGESGVMTKSNMSLKKHSTYSSNELAWHTGILQFENASLPNVFSDLNAYYDLEFKAEFAGWEKLELNTIFDNATKEVVIKTLELTLDAKCVKNNNTYVFSKIVSE